MPTHDIIDNRNKKLVEHINRILASSASARFAVGYFFLSGFSSIAERLQNLKELRLLIGNTTNRETLEQLVEGHNRLELAREALEAESYRTRGEAKQIAENAAANLRASMESMDQTEENVALVQTLARMIEEQRLKVRIYTKGRLHAKAYVFDYGEVFDAAGNCTERHERGLAIVGSSNLSLAGVSHNTELNVIVQGNANHAELVRWFDALWEESQDFDEALMREMRQSWAMAEAKPYDIYMKTLYTLLQERLEGEEDASALWEDDIMQQLADFQKVAVRQVIQMIRRYNGAFVADVVGLGKSYIGAAIVKHFERTEHARPLILCPASLVEMWEHYNEVYHLNARVLSMGFLREENEGRANPLSDDVRFRDRDFVLIDESHNLRHSDTQRYKVVENFLRTGKRCCLLTATPRNKSAWDVYHQIKLFHQEDKTDLPIDPPDLKEYFKRIEAGEKQLPELLYHLQVRRLRKHVLRGYGFAADTHQPLREMSHEQAHSYLRESKGAYVMVAGQPRFFPKRKLETVEYSIEETYQGLYQKLRSYLGQKHEERAPSQANVLRYARYGLGDYVRPEKRRTEPYASLHKSGANLRDLMRVSLFKRFESSVFAFKQTLARLIKVHYGFLLTLREEKFVPAGKKAQKILYEADLYDDAVFEELGTCGDVRYALIDFDAERLERDIQHDLALLEEMEALVSPITPGQDAKLRTLREILSAPPLREGKRLIFTQYADTARYLFEQLNPNGKREDVAVVFSDEKNKPRLVGRFAPKANPEYRLREGDTELMTLIATDVLAEGLNLQDCDKIINYDLHWNPVRLIQRLGRIDRIGSEHEVIYGFNFLPETGIDKNLGLKEKLRRRIREIHETIGEDAAVLDQSEQLNEAAMYAIYESKDATIEMEEEGEAPDLNEAEQMLRQLRQSDPTEYERIANLRDGIRAAKLNAQKGVFVFCAAEDYHKTYLVDDAGNIASTDLARVLSAIRCAPSEPSHKLPANYNVAVMKVKRHFAEEVKHRRAEQEHNHSLSSGQKYVLRELRLLFGACEDEETRTRINVLAKAYRGALTGAAQKEINALRRNKVTGQALLKSLANIYHEHRMRDWTGKLQPRTAHASLVRVVCSEALG